MKYIYDKLTYLWFFLQCFLIFLGFFLYHLQFSLCYPLRRYLHSRNFGLNSLEVNQRHDMTYSVHYLFAYGDGICVCVYTLPTVGFFRLHEVCDIRDQRSFVASISRSFFQVPSSLFLNLPYSTSKDENSSRTLTGEKTIYVCPRKDDIYWYRIL